MKIEKFRTPEGLMIRAKDKDARLMFRHCAGADAVPSKRIKDVVSMLFLHGVGIVEFVNHASV